MKQGELFTSDAPPPTATPLAMPDLRRRLQADLGLWVDPFTLEYIGRALARGTTEMEFIAADARSGRSAFHVMPAKMLRGE